MVNISPRLAALADWVISDQPVADIGSDHAGLAIYLLASGKCPQAIITDISPLPLARARHMLNQQGLDNKCDFRLGDGLEPLKPGEVATVCVAGMGGQTMAEIIGNAAPGLASYQRLLLQPMNVFLPLRKFLSRSGYPILRERAVREGAGCFIILEVGTCAGNAYELSDLQSEVGPYVLEHPSEYDNRDYLQIWQNKYTQRIQKMQNSSRMQVINQCRELEQRVFRIKEVLAHC